MKLKKILFYLRQKKNKIDGQPATSGESGVQKKKEKAATPQVEQTLDMLQHYLVEKQKTNKNVAFGQYLALTLDDMPPEEQNFKKLKMVEILHAPYKP